MVSASAFYIIADLTMADELHGLVGITVVVFVISFFVATMFTEVRSKNVVVYNAEASPNGSHKFLLKYRVYLIF